MLKNLNIENIAVIEKSNIEFESGLNVLTGETGAGKSIVIDSINAILGERTSRELVRNGENNAVVSALFVDVNESVNNKLCEFDIDNEEDNSLLISRKITADGKSSCKINGRSVTVSMLKEIGKLLINIHGQHDSQALLNPEFHYQFIDMLSNDSKIYDDYYSSFKELIFVRRKLKNLSVNEDEKERKIEMLTYQVEELEKADIKIGEREELQKKRELMLNSESVVSSLNNAFNAINGTDEFSGAFLLMNDACNHVSVASKYDEDLIISIKRMYDTLYCIEEYKDLIRDKLDTIQYDPNELELIEERLDSLSKLSLKYGKTEEEMLSFLNNAKNELNSIMYADEEMEKLTVQYNEILEKTVKLADALHEHRIQIAKRFEKNVKAELEYLDMPNTSFVVDFKKGKLSTLGYDEICFLISTNAGEPPKPINKIASGGELSRIMLAIKNIIAHNDTVSTLIFDEIDTGVSGRASQKIGFKLKKVASNCQVICVTHSAQIAAVADSHYLISKQVKSDKTYTEVQLLNFEQRKKEIARIIGGLNITDTILKSAEELLNINSEDI